MQTLFDPRKGPDGRMRNPRRFLIRGRVGPGYNFHYLFHHEYFVQRREGKDLAEALWRKIEESKCGRTLFVLDGLDEVVDILHSDMGNFLGHLLNQPNVVITARPHASFPLYFHPLDLEVETIGFNPEQVKSYLENTNIVHDQQKAEEI